jgi:acetolactate synthase regulatory subunit
MTKKRGYSKDFTPKTTRRVQLMIDRVPPTLFERIKRQVKRRGLSVRSVGLALFQAWVEKMEQQEREAK